MTDNSSRNVLILWSLVMLGLAFWVPAGFWTSDDGIKSIAARHGDAPYGSPVKDDSLRTRLANPAEYSVFVEPNAKRIENGVAPGFSPYARLYTRLESVISRRGLIVVTTLVAIGLGWLLYGAGLAWGFLLLPLTFYGLVPWEHGLALGLSSAALISIFLNDRASPFIASLNGVLLIGATALRPEHGLLLIAGLIFLLVNRRGKEALIVGVAGAFAGTIIVGWAGTDEMFRQVVLNLSTTEGWTFIGRGQAILDSCMAMGSSTILSVLVSVMLIFSLSLLDQTKSKRLLTIMGWGGVAMFVLVSYKVVWGLGYPPYSMLRTGSIVFAMPWIFWLFIRREVWKTKAMAYATAVLMVGIILLPQSSGLHWGPRLLLFAAPLFLIALYQANLHQTKAFAALVVLGLVQSVHSGLLVQARYTESTEHVTRLETHAGSPMITTTRAQAIDLASMWGETEFFVASTPDELKNLLIEFYEMRLDSAWLHLMSADSLLIHTFPENKPVWPHRMTVINCGNLYKSQWRMYQLVMNRADPAWIPLLEGASGQAMNSGDFKRALFLQDDVLRIDPNRAIAHSKLGLILAGMGKSYDAKKAVERALELDSTLSQARELGVRLDQLPAGATK